MYPVWLFIHSLLRWLVVISLIISIYRAYRGLNAHATFTLADDRWRHWTATIAHIQLIVGVTLYIQSPIIKYFWQDAGYAIHNTDNAFFALLHITLMVTAIVVLTVGSALAKRKPTDKEKFKTMLVWFSIAAGIIFIAIPWPFSPLANRPYIRHF